MVTSFSSAYGCQFFLSFCPIIFSSHFWLKKQNRKMEDSAEGGGGGEQRLSEEEDGTAKNSEEDGGEGRNEMAKHCSEEGDDRQQNKLNSAFGDEEGLFDIPELPTGEVLLFELLSSWGDDSLVGLGCVELFSADGVRPELVDVSSNASESMGDLRNLIATDAKNVKESAEEPEASIDESDQRTSAIAGNCRGGFWLCKYCQGQQPPVQIAVRFALPQTLAMIRISNFAGSRVHALRGVRNLRIWLDNHCIFRGEICCAFTGGAFAGDPLVGDTILFTTNDEILAKIAEHDGTLGGGEGKRGEGEDGAGEEEEEEEEGGSDGGDEGHFAEMAENAEQQLALLAISQSGDGTEHHPLPLPRPLAQNRPTTGHSASPISSSSASSSAAGGRQKKKEEDGEESEAGEAEGHAEEVEEAAEELVIGRVFHMELLANWGCADAIGLAGLQFLGPRFEPIDDRLMRDCVVRCEPSTAGSQNGGELANLLNGHNLTCRQKEMWLIEWNTQSPAPMLNFTFSQDVQDVLFERCPLIRPPSSRPQTRSVAAFIFQIRLLSSWGDEFYIGLNGIELYGRGDALLPMRLRPQNLAAFPESVNCLATVRSDPRTSDKLIDGTNDTTKAHHMWLTPILANSFARIFVIFDAPTFVTRIRIYNYRKTPARGARHIAVSADDLLLCSGAEVPMSSARETGMLDISLRDVE